MDCLVCKSGERVGDGKGGKSGGGKMGRKEAREEVWMREGDMKEILVWVET